MPDFARDGDVGLGVAKAKIHCDLIPYGQGQWRFEEQAVKTDVPNFAFTRLVAIGIFQTRPVRYTDGLSPVITGAMMMGL